MDTPQVYRTTYRVAGMTCAHCRLSVIEEIAALAGVDSVEVELGRGLVAVSGDGFTDEQVAAAVDEAGYELEGRA